MHRPRQSPSPARERRRVAVLVVLALGGCPKARAPEPVDPAPPPAPSTAATEDWHDVQERALAAMWRDLDPDAAREAFERVVVLQPDEASTYHHLSMLYADEGAWTEAIAAAERSVALAPEDPERLDALGEVLLMAGRLDDAAAAFGRALDRAPGFPLAHEGVAYVHFHRGEWAAGWSVLEQAIAASDDASVKARLQRTLGWAQLAGGRANEGEALLVGLAGDDAFRRAFVQAEVAIEREQWPQASAAAARAHELLPASADELGRRWLTLLQVVAAARSGDVALAEELVHRLEERHTELPPHITKDLTFARGHVALARGDAEAAVAAFTDRWVLNHTSVYDPGRGNPGPSFNQFALEGWRLAAEALAKAGRAQEARAILERLTQTRRRGIGAVGVWVRAQAALTRLESTP